MDDGLITAECEQELKTVMNGLTKKFKMSACKLGLFLGMEIDRDESGQISISQRTYSE